MEKPNGLHLSIVWETKHSKAPLLTPDPDPAPAPAPPAAPPTAPPAVPPAAPVLPSSMVPYMANVGPYMMLLPQYYWPPPFPSAQGVPQPLPHLPSQPHAHRNTPATMPVANGHLPGQLAPLDGMDAHQQSIIALEKLLKII